MPGNDPATIKAIDQEYSRAVDAYLNYSASTLLGDTAKKQNPNELARHVKAALDTDKIDFALTLIKANITTITNKIDSPRTVVFVEHLLDYGLLDTALQIVNHAHTHASVDTNSTLHYQLALYYSVRDDTDSTIYHLTQIQSSDALTRQEQDYATILFGISLQKKHKHREAISIYRKIDESSEYYSSAQLNTAIAHITQGWWTDGQLAIEAAIKHQTSEQQTDATDRLHVVLGYSQLKSEFYRNARNTFRNVNIGSPYVARALLGIGLCALHQKDYAGALNAFKRLSAIPGFQLPVAESYLLLAFTYENAGELNKATNSYTQALAYYAAKIQELEQEAASADLQNILSLASVPPEIPRFLVSQINLLSVLHKDMNSDKSPANIESLYKRMAYLFESLHKQAIKKNIGHIKSYQSQSQFGLAKLYDNK